MLPFIHVNLVSGQLILAYLVKNTERLNRSVLLCKQWKKRGKGLPGTAQARIRGSVLHQAMKSVPGFLGIGGFWFMVLNSCVGMFQGLVGGILLPRVGKKLSQSRLSFLMLVGLLISCVLPAAVIVLLDTYCLGNWLVLWSPCRSNPEHFNRIAHVAETDPLKPSILHFMVHVQLLSSSDMCDSHQSRAQTTPSKCIQVALLRLQDFWLPKIMISGMVLPAYYLARNRHYKDSTQFVGSLAMQIAYAMIAAGHLPLAMPLLWLSMLSITVLAAVSWHEQCLHHNLTEQSTRSIVALPQAVSTLIHAASLSGNSLLVRALQSLPSPSASAVSRADT